MNIDIKFYNQLPYLDHQLPYLDKIQNAKSFYYWSIYDLGCGYHTIIFWKTKEDICYFLEDYAKDNIKKIFVSSVIHYRKIDFNKFDVFMTNLVSKGIMNLTIKEASILSNLHSYEYILLENTAFHGFQTGVGFESKPVVWKIHDIAMKMKLEYVCKGIKIKKRDGKDFYEK